MRFFRHDGIYRSDVSSPLFTPGRTRFPVGPVPRYRTRRKAHALPIVRDEFRPAIPRRVARQHCPPPLHRHHQIKTIAALNGILYHRTVASLLTVRLSAGDKPIEQVDWNQASDYCNKIGGRLPTETEWEYAARAGTTGARYGVLGDIAWYSDNSGGMTHPVALKLPNAFGLYDMLGNVWEWTADSYDTGTYKILRGGDWGNDPDVIRASFRFRLKVTDQSKISGLRCAGAF